MTLSTRMSTRRVLACVLFACVRVLACVRAYERALVRALAHDIVCVRARACVRACFCGVRACLILCVRVVVRAYACVRTCMLATACVLK